jgi:hypothetical protein
VLAKPGAGIQLLQFLQAARMNRPLAIRCPIQRDVMNNDQLTITTDVKVQLDDVGAQLDGMLKGCHRILGRHRRGPSMCDIQHYDIPSKMAFSGQRSAVSFS